MSEYIKTRRAKSPKERESITMSCCDMDAIRAECLSALGFTDEENKLSQSDAAKPVRNKPGVLA